jgi:hypothetical protein
MHKSGKKSSRASRNQQLAPLVRGPNWNKVAGQSQSELRRITYSAQVSTNGAGFHSLLVGSAYMRANGVEWASYAARFTEYRILGVRLYLTTAPGETGLDGPVLLAVDNSGVLGAPTTIAQVWGMAKSKLFNINTTSPRPIEYAARAIDLEDMNFTAVGVNATTFQAILAAQSSFSLAYGYLFVEWAVEFRSTQ